MKLITKIFACFSMFYLTVCIQGCSSSMSPEEQNVRNFNEPVDGKSAIYLYRISRFYGGGKDVNIVFDNKKIVELENGSFIFIPTSAGSHTLLGTQSDWIHSLVVSEDLKGYPMRIKTEENTNYFVEYNYSDGKFLLKTKEEALGEIKECDYLPLIK